MKLRSKIFTAAAVSSTVLIGGAAYAFFTGGGSATGTATAGTSTNFQISLAENIPTINIGATVPVKINVTNVAAGPQRLSDLGIAITNVASNPLTYDSSLDGCLPTDFVVTQPTVGDDDLSPTQNVVYTGAITLTNSITKNQNNCRGASVTLSFVANPTPPAPPVLP